MKRVVLINDISGIGRCSLGAGIPILSCLGLQVSPLATAVLTNQTAYPTYYKVDMDDIFDNAVSEWSKLNVKADGCIMGFFTSSKQIDKAKAFYNSIRHNYTILILDPIMGDDGHKYSSFDNNLCGAICEFAKTADVITPNFTEACILADVDYYSLCQKNTSPNYIDIVADKFFCLLNHNKAVAVTGIKDIKNNQVYNILLTNKGIKSIPNTLKEGTFSGAGDIFTAVLGGLIIKGFSIITAFEKACDFVASAIQLTRADIDRREGLDFEPILAKLTDIN